jgi:hypothetical protein
MKACRDCQHVISEQAISCPHCGAPYPAREKWDGWGFEYKSKTILFGLPLLHISFKYRPNWLPVPAKGIIAIGQFAQGFISIGQFGLGVINISQIGAGIVSISQITVAAYAVAQAALACSGIAQEGLFLQGGSGQCVWNILGLN